MEFAYQKNYWQMIRSVHSCPAGSLRLPKREDADSWGLRVLEIDNINIL